MRPIAIAVHSSTGMSTARAIRSAGDCEAPGSTQKDDGHEDGGDRAHAGSVG